MTEETPETAETPVVETPETAESSMTGGKLDATPVEESAKEELTPPTQYPEGFDESTYDVHAQKIKPDGVLAREAALKEEADKFKKQAQDMRKIISKGKAKEDAAEYVEGYVPQDEYSKYYDFETEGNESVKESVEQLGNLATEQGLNSEQFRAVTDFMNTTMEKAGVFDTRTPEQVEVERNDWLAQENKKLSDDPVEAVRIINQNVEFVQGMNMFTEAEKERQGQWMDAGALDVSIINKYRTLFGGESKIPTMELNDSGLSSDASLAEEYYSKDTSVARRQEIMQKRREAGRTSPMPLPIK